MVAAYQFCLVSVLTIWLLLKFQILIFPCSGQVGGPLGTGSLLDYPRFPAKGFPFIFIMGSICAQRGGIRPGGASPPNHLEAFPHLFLCLHSRIYIPPALLLPPGPAVDPQRQASSLWALPASPGASLLQGGGVGHPPLLLLNQEVETVGLSLP